MQRFFYAVAMLVCTSTTLLSQQTGLNAERNIRDVIRADNCEVKTINSVEVAARTDGALDELLFEEGDEVKRGDVLATVDDRAAELMVKLKLAEEKEAMINGTNDINYRDAVASQEVAEAEYKSFKELQRDGAIAFWEMEKKRLEADRQKLRIELAGNEKKIAEVRFIGKRSEVEMAKHERLMHQVVAPVTGVIEKRIAQQGAYVQAGTPVCLLIQMDKLRVAGSVDALKYPGSVRKGSPVIVTVLSGERQVELNGQIGYVSLNVDINGRNEIWVDIENEKVDGDWLYKPGMQAAIEIIPQS